MSYLKLVFSEISYRRLNFLLSLTAIVTAAALFVAGPALLAGHAADTARRLEQMQDEADRELKRIQGESDRTLAEMDKQTRRIMRDLGVNLRIVHRDTNLGNLYTDFVAHDFPEEYVQRLAEAEQIETIVHLVATIQQKMKWNDRTILLVGMLPVLTQSQKNEEKPHMVKDVKPGTVLVGHELGVGLQVGDKLEIEGHEFEITDIRPESGTLEDIQLILHLHDAQKVLEMPGRIHQIMALNCKCKGDRISLIRQELEGVLPDTKVTEHLTRATAREQQRDLVEKKAQQQIAMVSGMRHSQMELVRNNRQRSAQSLQKLIGVTTPLVVLVSATFVGLLTWLNVRERRPEIGLLRALGKGSWNIGVLFLGKSMLLGLLGGMTGCLLGFLLARWVGSYVMGISADFFQPNRVVLAATVVGAPLVAAMASYLPTLSAVTQDPAVVLSDN